jgi:hypothetical protein
MSNTPRATGDDAQPVTELPRLLRLPQVAELGQVSLWTVRAEIARGNLVAKRIGRCLRVTTDDYCRWVAGR